jgi:toxin ParE1/3/4
LANIFKRPRAKADLAEIWDYIADDSEDRADAFIETISKKMTILAENPDIGRARGELGQNIRSFPMGRYIIFYLPIQGGIDVVRVLHAARDLETSFSGEE